MSKDTKPLSLIARSLEAHKAEVARLEREKREQRNRELESRLAAAHRVVTNVLHVSHPERLEFERTSDAMGCPALVFEIDGLLFRVRDGERHLNVRCNREWQAVYTLAGLGGILAESDGA